MLRTMADALPPDARFWNRFARRYARMKVPDEASYRHKLDRTRAYLTPQARVFEFGCGTGTTALHHAPHVAHVRGVDFAPEMIAIAREKAAAQGAANAEFAVGTVEADGRLAHLVDVDLAQAGGDGAGRAVPTFAPSISTTGITKMRGRGEEGLVRRLRLVHGEGPLLDPNCASAAKRSTAARVMPCRMSLVSCRVMIGCP
jgi:SAM-dependent methyltransferase